MAVRIVLADDHKILREGLRALLERETDLEVVGEANDGQEAVGLALALQPDIVVMDVAMPAMGGIEACRKIVAARPWAKVVALSTHADRRFVNGMAQAGACGYLLKDCASEEMVSAIRKVLAGGTCFSSQ